MKKRIVSLLMAVALCFSTLPMTAFAQETDVTAGQEEVETVAEQEKTVAAPDAQDGENTGEENVTEENLIAENSMDDPAADGKASGDVSGGDAAAQDAEKDAALQAVQALIDALPDEVTAENAEDIGVQLAAVDEALAALADEQLAELDMTRYEAICAALAAFAAVQDGGHTHYICGTEHHDIGDHTTDEEITFTKLWMDSDGTLKIGDTELTATTITDRNSICVNQKCYILPEGNYYLENSITLDYPLYIASNGTSSSEPYSNDVKLCLNGKAITANGDFNAIICSSYVSSTTFALTDCQTAAGTITHAEGKTGSGVVLYSYGSDSNGTRFHMYGGSITGNVTKNGGGVYAEVRGYGGIFNLYDGVITGNKAEYGGGVCMDGQYSRFTMNGGEIKNNTADQDGGGVREANSEFTMNGGSITNNSAANGAGVSVGCQSTAWFTMNGGEISNNTAGNNGGGVYVGSAGRFNVNGTPYITGNTGGSGTNNVYLSENKTITVKSELTDGASIGVTTEKTPQTGGFVRIAVGSTDHELSDTDKEHFSLDTAGSCILERVGNTFILKNDGDVTLHSHPVCGAVCDHTAVHENEVWMGISDLNEIKSDGNYYLTAPVNLLETWVCSYNVKLCLNGQTITGADKKNAIDIKSYVSLDITDCQQEAGKITHNTGSHGRGVNIIQGTFTMWNGIIAGNKANSSEGGGVYVNGNTTFTMWNGTITGNEAATYGGGVSAHGEFIMNGGTITGNNTTASNDVRGGGVYVDNNSTFAVSGTVQIENNWKNGTLENGVYVQGDSGQEGNVYLGGKNPPLAIITIGEGLTENSRIGVIKTSAWFDKGENIKIATGATGSVDYTKIFTPDASEKTYLITRDEEGNLYMGLHQHNWTYTQSENGAAITAACIAEGCSDPDGGSVTIKAPDADTLTYDGSEKTATLENHLRTGENAPDISYTMGSGLGNNLPAGSLPTNVGTYTASITMGDATASVTYEIKKAAPAVKDFVFATPYNLTYDGNAKNVKVAAAQGITGMGNVTVKYYQDGVEVNPINVGDYTVEISVAEGTNFTEASRLTDANWAFTIAANTSEPTVDLSGSMIYTGNKITPEVTVKIGDTTLVEGTDYTITYDDNTNAGTDAGAVTVTAKGNYAFAAVTKKFTIEKAKPELSFAESAMNKTYIDKTFTNTLTQTKGDGKVTYASGDTAVATVNESTGEVTIVGVGETIIAATPNYEQGTADYKLTVDKAVIHFSRVAADNKTYDGSTKADVTVSFADRNNDSVDLQPDTDYTATGTFRSPNVSVSSQQVDVRVTLSDDCAKKYVLEADTYETVAHIFAKSVGIVKAAAESRSYEKGNISVTISDVTFAGVVETLKKDIDYTASGVMESADAGTDKSVTVTVTLLGDAANNYSLSSDKYDGVVTITQATAEIITASTQTLVKNGAAVDISRWVSFTNTDSDAKLTYTLAGTPTGITLNGSMLTAANSDNTADNFDIRVTAEATGNFIAPEEKIITVNVVDKISVGINIEKIPEAYKVTYGTPDFGLTASFDGDVPDDDNGTWNWESSDDSVLEIISGAETTTPVIKVKKVGHARLTVTYTSDNYFGSAGVAITVAAKEVTADMIADIPAQNYTGKDIKPVPEVSIGTTKLIPGTDFDYSYSNNRDAGTATVTISGTGNYTGTACRNFTITPMSVSGAVIVLDTESFVYNGSEQTVNITSVKLPDGTILTTDDYDIKDNSNKATDASDSITLTIEGRGNYTGTAATTWKITKTDPGRTDFVVTPDDLTTALTYDGKAKPVTVAVRSGINGMGRITVKYNGSTQTPINAGSYAVTFDVNEGINYNGRTGFEVGTLTIDKAVAPTLEDIKENCKYTLTGGKTVELADLVADATGYTLGEIAGEKDIIADCSVDATGRLKYTLTGKGKIDDTVTLPVTITSVNYEDATVNVVITLTAKDDQAALSITGENTVVYGRTLTLGTTGGSGTGKVTYSIDKAGSTGDAVIDANGVLTPVKIGSITIRASKAGDTDYNEAVSAAFVITITQAAPTGEPKYTGITMNGKTLADAGLTLTDSTLSPADGMLEWVNEAGDVLSGDTRVEVNKTYTWRFIPADDNYGILTGVIELYHVDAPVISVQPKCVTVQPGDKAVFEVKAEGTDLTYQWMIDRNDGNGFVAVAGADGASYTSGVTDLDCNGFQYYCIISNIAGSVTTDTVTLMVLDNTVPTPEPTATPTPTATPAPATDSDADPYRIIDGADSSWTQNTDGTLAIRGNGEFAKFVNVKVDGQIIDPGNYTVTEGSTIITLKAEYLKTLSEGSHTFEIVWTDGTAGTSFTVAANTSADDDDDSSNADNGNNTGSNNNTVPAQVTAPKTGDASGYWILLFAISCAGFAGMLVRRKK